MGLMAKRSKITAAEAAAIRLRADTTCQACGGHGYHGEEHGSKQECWSCNGTGRKYRVNVKLIDQGDLVVIRGFLPDVEDIREKLTELGFRSYMSKQVVVLRAKWEANLYGKAEALLRGKVR